MANVAYIEERLRAYIRPRVPETTAQENALTRAIDAQAAYEDAVGMDGIPPGAQSIANDGVSITFAGATSTGDGYTAETLSPTAKAILINAGLIRRSWPTARKP